MSEIDVTNKHEHHWFKQHDGIWEGTYVVFNARSGQIIDQFHSKLTCKQLNDNDYHQTNEYTWSDGRTLVKEFPGQFRDGELYFDNSQLSGRTYQVNSKTMIFAWKYKEKDDESYSEIITLENPIHRCRTWQHFKGGEFIKITVIDEKKVA